MQLSSSLQNGYVHPWNLIAKVDMVCSIISLLVGHLLRQILQLSDPYNRKVDCFELEVIN